MRPMNINATNEWFVVVKNSAMKHKRNVNGTVETVLGTKIRQIVTTLEKNTVAHLVLKWLVDLTTRLDGKESLQILAYSNGTRIQNGKFNRIYRLF